MAVWEIIALAVGLPWLAFMILYLLDNRRN